MKITRVETWMLRFPYRREAADADSPDVELVGAYVTTEAGGRGMGYTYTLRGGGESIKALLDHLVVPMAEGRDTDEVDVIWREIWWRTHRLGLGVSMLALAALDIAIWDAVARAQAKPLFRVLGGHRPRVPAYGSGRASPRLTLEELVRTSVEFVEQGFGAVKIRVGPAGPEEDLRRLRAVRKAIGDGARMMCDANETLTPGLALRYAGWLRDLDVFWFEEPLLADDIAGHVTVQAHADLPIAVGEHLFSRHQFHDWIQRGAASIFQPDAAMVGGVTEWMKIALLADAAARPVAPHFLTELHVHLAAAVPNSIYVEYYPFMEEFFQERLEVRDGCVLAPERPGHGLEFREDLFRRYRVA